MRAITWSLLRGRRGRREGHPDAERVENGEHLARLAGFFSLLQLDNEPQARSGRERERFLSDAQFLARFPYEFPDIRRCVSSSPRSRLKVTVREDYNLSLLKEPQNFPSGNICPWCEPAGQKYSRAGISGEECAQERRLFPSGNSRSPAVVGLSVQVRSTESNYAADSLDLISTTLPAACLA